MKKWHKRFINMATLVSSWSKDPSTQVGAVIVDPKNRIVSVGFNGFAQGVEDSYTNRDEKLRRTIHAEENAILFANRSVEGCTLYVTHHPCARCTAKIIQVGISAIVYRDPLNDNWEDEVKSSDRMLYEACISCTPIDLT